jgi:hypothetical protein
MNKYGSENFSIEEVEECSAKEVSDREIYWIEQYGSFKNGYNATKGGDGTHYADYDLIYNLWQAGKTCGEINKITNYDIATIATALNENNVSMTERQERSRAALYHPVAKIDIQTNEVLEVYPSVSAAERANGNTRHIGQACKDNRKVVKGFKWKYLKDL